MKKLYKWHKALKWPVVVFAFLWLTSGALHPVLSMIRPRPAMRMAPKEKLNYQPKQKDLLAVKNLIDGAKVDHLRYVSFNGSDYLQFRVEGEKICRYWDLVKSVELIRGDQVYARYLASYYLQDFESQTSYEGLVTEFGKNYSFINRFLPVHKVVVESKEKGKMYVYIHTLSSRLGRINNDSYLFLSGYFQNFHTFNFLNDFELLRVLVLGAALILIGFVSISGIIIWWKMRKVKRTGWLLWHRRLGVFLFLPLFLFCFSAIFHLIVRSPMLVDKQAHYRMSLSLDDVKFQPVKGDLLSLSFAKLPNGELYQSAKISSKPFPRTVILNQHGDSVNDLDFAKVLAEYYAGGAVVEEVEKVTKFGGEYGFVNKRMPVWRASIGDERYYVENSSLELALKVNPVSYAEGWSFANLHKWHSLDPLLKKVFKNNKHHMVRNLLLINMALLTLILALSSLWMKAKK